MPINSRARLWQANPLELKDGYAIDSVLVRGFYVERDGFFRLDKISIERKAVIDTYTSLSPGCVTKNGEAPIELRRPKPQVNHRIELGPVQGPKLLGTAVLCVAGHRVRHVRLLRACYLARILSVSLSSFISITIQLTFR